MIRFLLFFCAFTSIAAAFMWFTENDGLVTLDWLGYRIHTSFSVLVLLVVLICVTCTFLVQSFLWFVRTPRRLRNMMLARNQTKGLEALTQGFVAIASGDGREARNFARRAETHLGKTTLTRLLSVQTAQLEGNVDAVRSEYTAMLEHKETEIIAVKGLLVQARQDRDWDKVVFLCEKIQRMKTGSDWILPILLDGYKRTRQWRRASDTLDLAFKKHQIDDTAYHHLSSVLHIAEARSTAPTDMLVIMDLLHTAYKRENDFAPAALCYAERLIAVDEPRKARRVLENAFERTNHPQLLEQLDALFETHNSAKRYKMLEKILAPYPDHVEGRLILARTAIAAGDLPAARVHLITALNLRETVYGCKLMASLLRKESAPQETIDEWTKRAENAASDPIWQCTQCHHRVIAWQHECPSCRSFDSLGWEHVEVVGTLYSPEPRLITQDV